MKSERLLSLDVLRGITIVGMILVNNPGTWESIYAPLRHAEWNGLTPTDLVFPFFMFIMGVSMSFALSRFDHHFSRGFIIKLVRRTVILFLLGLFLSWFSLVCTGVEQPFSHIRILGVLQRLALAYFFGSLLIVGVRRPANLAWISAIILIGYTVLLALGNGFELSEQNIIAGYRPNIVRRNSSVSGVVAGWRTYLFRSGRAVKYLAVYCASDNRLFLRKYLAGEDRNSSPAVTDIHTGYCSFICRMVA